MESEEVNVENKLCVKWLVEESVVTSRKQKLVIPEDNQMIGDQERIKS